MHVIDVELECPRCFNKFRQSQSDAKHEMTFEESFETYTGTCPKCHKEYLMRARKRIFADGSSEFIDGRKYYEDWLKERRSKVKIIPHRHDVDVRKKNKSPNRNQIERG